MNLLEIKKYPDSILRKKGEKIDEISLDIERLASDMLTTMYRDQGIGLAAHQVGLEKRMLVCDIGRGPLILINPKICGRKGKEIMKEGCLSFPGIFLKIKRAKQVVVKALNLDGKKVKVKADGLLARVLQHEIDLTCTILKKAHRYFHQLFIIRRTDVGYVGVITRPPIPVRRSLGLQNFIGRNKANCRAVEVTDHISQVLQGDIDPRGLTPQSRSPGGKAARRSEKIGIHFPTGVDLVCEPGKPGETRSRQVGS